MVMQPTQDKRLQVNIDYRPNPKQSEFHRSEAKYRLYIGAWRGGKTFAGCQEAYKKSILYAGNRGLIGRKDFTDLRETTIKTFFEVVPENVIASYNKTEHVVQFINGSEVIFRELKDGTGLGSHDLGWYYIDEGEEVEEQINTRLKGRLSLVGVGKTQGWITSNPPNEDHWLYQTFEVKEKDNPDYFTVHASTYENKDHLPDGYIEDLEDLPPSWRKKYLEGDYGFTPDGTPFYMGYQEDMHKTKVRIPWNTSLPLLCGWDSGKRHPAFCVTQWNGKHWNILAEILGSNITIDRFVDFYVIPLLNSRFPNANCIHYAGPEFLQVNDKSDYTSFQILSSKGIKLRIKHSEYSLRKELIEKKINTIVDGTPAIQVDPSCKIINDGFLGGYRYPNLPTGGEFKARLELPFKDGFYEHLMNALEYIAVHIFSPVSMRHGQRKQREATVEWR